VSVRWEGDAAKQLVRDRVAQSLIAIAALVQGEHMRDLSQSYPPASRPGEFPHGRTWNLRSSVDYEPKSKADVAATGRIRIGYQERAKYIVWLVQWGRKWLMDTVERVRPRIDSVLKSINATVERK
jgi:hypothetical protein